MSIQDEGSKWSQESLTEKWVSLSRSPRADAVVVTAYPLILNSTLDSPSVFGSSFVRFLK